MINGDEDGVCSVSADTVRNNLLSIKALSWMVLYQPSLFFLCCASPFILKNAVQVLNNLTDPDLIFSSGATADTDNEEWCVFTAAVVGGSVLFMGPS